VVILPGPQGRLHFFPFAFFAKRTQFSAFSTQKQRLPKKRTQFEPKQERDGGSRPISHVTDLAPDVYTFSLCLFPFAFFTKRTQIEPIPVFLVSWIPGFLGSLGLRFLGPWVPVFLVIYAKQTQLPNQLSILPRTSAIIMEFCLNLYNPMYLSINVLCQL
jgi:hypothetical protein